MSQHPVWNSRPMRAAQEAGDLGAVVRLVRRAHAMTQTELGLALHVSASTISRLETGRQPLTDTGILKLLAERLTIPPRVLGLAADERSRNAVITTTAVPIPARPVSVGGAPCGVGEGGDDPVRRRQLLADLAVAAGATAIAPRLVGASAARATDTDDPGALLVARTEDVLLGLRSDATPASLPTLRGVLSGVVGDFQACQYARLADRLPRLVAAAEATHDHSGDADRQETATILAQVYNVTTRMLIKLDEDHIAWISGDRARSAAKNGDDALTFAEATRNLCILTRTAGRHEKARDLAIDAARQLKTAGPDQKIDARYLPQYGLLLSTAGYSAAKTGDRSGSRELLDEAASAAGRVTGRTGDHWTGFGAPGVRLYRMSSALVLGDAGTAIDHARRIRPGELPTVERRARYWVDVGRAFGMWGKYEDCYRALLAAERAAPEETRSLPVVRTLVHTLAANTRRSATPGLREFARRVHARI